MVVALSACSAGDDPEPSEGPYAAEIAIAAESATSDFEREVLSDGILTATEYREAVTLLVDCMADAGVEVAIEEQGDFYIYSTTDGDGFDSVQPICSEGTTRIIEPLYVQMVSNPTNGDLHSLRAECLVKSGLAPEGYSLDDYRSDMSGTTEIVDIQSPEFGACMDSVAAYDD